MGDPKKDLEQLAADIRALSPPDKLRLAAQLLEHRRPEMAYRIVDDVRVELGAALLIARPSRG